jgi:hypothetical protein
MREFFSFVREQNLPSLLIPFHSYTILCFWLYFKRVVMQGYFEFEFEWFIRRRVFLVLWKVHAIKGKKSKRWLRDRRVRFPTVEDPMMKIPGRFSRETGSVCDSVESIRLLSQVAIFLRSSHFSLTRLLRVFAMVHVPQGVFFYASVHSSNGVYAISVVLLGHMNYIGLFPF